MWSDPKKIPKKAPKPFRYKRPVEPPKPKKATIAEIKRFFAR